MKLIPFGGQKSVSVPRGDAGWSTVLLPRSKYNYAKDISSSTIQMSSTIEAVLGWIVRNFPDAPIAVRRPGKNNDMETVPGHPMVQFFRRPNPIYTSVNLWYATVTDWWVDGNAYWMIVRNSMRKPIQLWYVPYWMIEPKGADQPTEQNFITYYEYKPYPGALLKLDPRDVVHFRHGLDSQNPRKGRSRLKSLIREVFTDEEAANWTAALLHNMGVPGMVISPAANAQDYVMTPDEVAATKGYVREHFTGDNRGDTMVFRGPITMSQFGFNPDQMNLRDLRKIPEERVSGVMGVAAIVAGLGAGLDRSTFANYSEAREASYEENIIPTQRAMAGDIDLKVLPEFDSDPAAETFFDTSLVRVMQEDKNKESERVTTQYHRGVIMRSEARSRLGYPAEKTDEVFMVPLSTELVGPGAPEPEPPAPVVTVQPPASLPPGVEGQPQDATAQDGQRGASGEPSRKAASGRDARYQRLLARSLRGHARKMQSEIGKEFMDLGRAAASHYPVKASEETPEQATARIMALMEDNIAMARASFNNTFSGTYSAVGETTFGLVSDHLSVEVGWNLSDPEARRIIATGGKRVGLVDIAADVKRNIFRAIEEGRAAGDNPRVIARSIRDEVGGTPRAEMIARTETKYAQNISTLEAYQKSRVVTGLRAFDNQTGYNDDDCTERDGQVYSFDEAARLTDEEHPNGTLSWSPVVGSSE